MQCRSVKTLVYQLRLVSAALLFRTTAFLLNTLVHMIPSTLDLDRNAS